MSRTAPILIGVFLLLTAGLISGQESSPDFTRGLVAAAIERTTHSVTYDGSYRKIDYPGGDVPDKIGVCTDLVIRAYRGMNIDLQKGVHEDMTAVFQAYPRNWGLTRPDPNIDHRSTRIPILITAVHASLY